MPIRDIQFRTGGVYHIFNKTVDGRKVFNHYQSAYHFLNVLLYYRSINAGIRYSIFRRLPQDKQNSIFLKVMEKDSYRVSVLAFCLMPNHFHLLLRQNIAQGIERYMADTINAFTRHINIKTKRNGPQFLPRFKAVEVISDEQLMHVSRYIHLNPYSSHIVKDKIALVRYPYSSLESYTAKKSSLLIEHDQVMKLFGGDNRRYEGFVMQNADYQEKLEHLKHTYNW